MAQNTCGLVLVGALIRLAKAHASIPLSIAALDRFLHAPARVQVMTARFGLGLAFRSVDDSGSGVGTMGIARKTHLSK